jgi:hypothetical protein
LKRFDVKVGDVYKVKRNVDSYFLEGEIIRVTFIDKYNIEYTYLSDGWTTKKPHNKFTDDQLELPTKLELYLFGATNVEMD